MNFTRINFAIIGAIASFGVPLSLAGCPGGAVNPIIPPIVVATDASICSMVPVSVVVDGVTLPVGLFCDGVAIVVQSALTLWSLRDASAARSLAAAGLAAGTYVPVSANGKTVGHILPAYRAIVIAALAAQ